MCPKLLYIQYNEGDAGSRGKHRSHCRHKNSSHVAFYIRICFSRRMVLGTLLTLYSSVSLLPMDVELLLRQPLKSITVSIPFKKPCYYHFQVLTFHSTVMNMLVFSSFSSVLDLVWLSVCDWGYQTVIQSEDWIRANSSITLSPFHSLYALSHIAKECFIIPKIPRHLSPPSCKLSPRKLLSPGELLYVIWYLCTIVTSLVWTWNWNFPTYFQEFTWVSD